MNEIANKSIPRRVAATALAGLLSKRMYELNRAVQSRADVRAFTRERACAR